MCVKRVWCFVKFVSQGKKCVRIHLGSWYEAMATFHVGLVVHWASHAHACIRVPSLYPTPTCYHKQHHAFPRRKMVQTNAKGDHYLIGHHTQPWYDLPAAIRRVVYTLLSRASTEFTPEQGMGVQCWYILTVLTFSSQSPVLRER